MRNALLTVGLGIVAMVLVFMTSACGWDGTYRYPCQDPANIGSAECEPPICEADGTCSKYLLPEEAIDD